MFVLVGALAGGCLAPELPLELNSGEQTRQADAFLRDRLGFWQSQLKLDEWTISVVMSHPDQLRRGTKGNIRWDAGTKAARIRVLHIADYPTPAREAYDDMEFTVVHELIHLQFSSLPRSEESRRDEEHAVNRLTEALLTLNRAR